MPAKKYPYPPKKRTTKKKGKPSLVKSKTYKKKKK
jgi:hypothetical protein